MSDTSYPRFNGPYSKIPAVSIQGDGYRAKIHERCETVMGVQSLLNRPVIITGFAITLQETKPLGFWLEQAEKSARHLYH
jgi:hypothetical protein